MKSIQSDIVIIGAGLTGLATAYYLKDSDLNITLIEARPRIGGRILTVGSPPQEMGATWLGKKHTALYQLLEELHLTTFEQLLGQYAIYEPISTSPHQMVQLPPNDEPSFRIAGGTSALLHALAKAIPSDQVYLKHTVKSIDFQQDQVVVQTAQKAFEAKVVISTLPPYLLAKTLTLTPALPTEVVKIMQQTHTWMGDSIKVSLSYDQPFWRANKNSGTLFSNVGPVVEMYDHSNVEDQKFALKGFLNGSYYSISKMERQALVLNQLRKYYGPVVDQFSTYEELVWRNEAFTFIPYNQHLLPHQNNGNPIYRQAFMDGKFYISGSETADLHPGYMDGAVRTAQFVAQSIQTQPIVPKAN